jgi:hypothetical protein|tara:strand:+ start:604 stop:2229 length:1626 start_codon:yes stop_codon:yes gene_type:complete
MAIQNKARQIKEIVKCGKDPIYFFKNYCKIQHPVKGLIAFDTFPFQDECVEMFIENRFSIILKSRQLGMSTLVAAFATWMVLFQKDKNVLIIATKLSVAQNFIRKVKTILRSLPPWLMLPTVTTNNKQLVEFSHGSSIKAIPTSEDAGRSEALSLLIVDEAAFVRNFDELWMGLYPTLSTGGRAILLSTPNGVGGQYYKLYTDAEANLNEFKPIKLPWNVHPERDQAWFEHESNNFSKRQVSQEFLCDFASSGDTFITNDELGWLYSNIRSPIDRWGFDKNIWVWSKPISGNNYIISADISRGDSKDYSAFHVINIDDSEIVAEYKGKIQPDRFAEMLHEVGTKYNNALLCPENNSYGYATILKLKELQYPNLYYPKRKGVYLGNYVPPSDTSNAGFTTSGKSRGLILTKLEEIIRNKQIKIYSSRFHEEVKTFIWKGNRAQAMKGYNDDLVMSLAIGIWIFDTADGIGKDSRALTDAMLKSIKVERNNYSGVSNTVGDRRARMSNFEDPRNSNRPKSSSTGNSKWDDRLAISKEFDWLIK